MRTTSRSISRMSGTLQELGIPWPTVTACRFVSLMDAGDEQGRAKSLCVRHGEATSTSSYCI